MNTVSLQRTYWGFQQVDICTFVCSKLSVKKPGMAKILSAIRDTN